MLRSRSIVAAALASSVAPACVYSQVEVRGRTSEAVTIVHAAPDEVPAGAAARVRLRYIEGPSVEVANADVRREGDAIVVGRAGVARPLRVPVGALEGVDIERVSVARVASEEHTTNAAPLVVGIVGGVILTGLIAGVALSRTFDDWELAPWDAGGAL